MSSKQLLVLLMLANVVLVVTGLCLFTTVDPSNIVRFARTYMVGTNVLFLLCNFLLYRKFEA